jgi:hypothetical protein
MYYIVRYLPRRGYNRLRFLISDLVVQYVLMLMSYSDNKIDILNLNIVFAHSIMTVDIKTEK